ncbi:hypothetical protein KDH_55820 [Dictyobacter sp. S3.2.2.5]|uniref:Uncharacterized protein n=1 Tax=Dictyobacter halimunensis TaxID=3026934 RepID=A0ABQ6FWW4_9CHLR|nr:hypothetical protein KDH_55820 [Dictyobacter sp. S3.2.2.5]
MIIACSLPEFLHLRRPRSFSVLVQQVRTCCTNTEKERGDTCVPQDPEHSDSPYNGNLTLSNT